MTHTSYLGIGSNIDAANNIRAGLDVLDAEFDLFCISSVYESEAIGFEGDPFLNLVLGMTTSKELCDLSTHLREIEFAHGRPVECSKFSPRTLDIDLLLFDQLVGEYNGVTLPRPEITENAFVLAPFAEVAPALVLPGHARTLATLWSNYSPAQKLARIRFEWCGAPLPQRKNHAISANFS